MEFSGTIKYKIKDGSITGLNRVENLIARFYSLDDLYNLYEGKNSKYRFRENSGGFNNPNRIIVSVILTKNTKLYLDSLFKENT
jgi:hypothetical protein